MKLNSAASTPNYVIAEADAKAAPKKTLGEHAYNFINYVLLGFAANIGLSFFLAKDNEIYKIHKGTSEVHDTEKMRHLNYKLPDWFHGFNERIADSVKPALYNSARNLPESWRKFGADKAQDSAALAKRGSNVITNTLLISWSGFLLTLPQNLLDRNKLKVVRELDGFFDCFRSERTEVQRQERHSRYAYIAENHEKRSLLNSVGNRLASMMLVIGASFTALLVDSERKGMNRLEDAFSTIIDKIEKVRGRKYSWSDGNPNTNTFSEKMISNIALETVTSSISLALEGIESLHKKKKYAATVIKLQNFEDRVQMEKEAQPALAMGMCA